MRGRLRYSTVPLDGGAARVAFVLDLEPRVAWPRAIRRIRALGDNPLVVVLHDCVKQRLAVGSNVLDDLHASPARYVPVERRAPGEQWLHAQVGSIERKQIEHDQNRGALYGRLRDHAWTLQQITAPELFEVRAPVRVRDH